MSIALPIPGVTTRAAAAVIINNSLNTLAARVVNIGGGSMVASLPIPLNEAQRTQWAGILNAYLTELEGRVTVVEISGGEPLLLEDSTTMTDQNDAPISV